MERSGCNCHFLGGAGPASRGLPCRAEEENPAAYSHTDLNSFLAADSLYSHRCTLPDRTLWFGKATLYEDRVHIRGWTWRGRYRKEIEVDEIDEVEWRPRPEGSNLILHLEDESIVPIRLRKGAGLWNAKLHDLLGQSVLGNHSLSGNGQAGEGNQEEGQDQETA